MKPFTFFGIVLIASIWFFVAATPKPAEVRAKDPKLAVAIPELLPNGIQRLYLDGHLYYWREHHRSIREGEWQPILQHAAGCTNHAPIVQAEASIGQYLRGGEPNFIQGVIKAEDLPPPHPMVVTNSLDTIIIGRNEARIVPGSGIALTPRPPEPITANLLLGKNPRWETDHNINRYGSILIHAEPFCDHEPSALGNNNGPTCAKCGKPIKPVYR